jgi:hypothetical protein
MMQPMTDLVNTVRDKEPCCEVCGHLRKITADLEQVRHASHDEDEMENRSQASI